MLCLNSHISNHDKLTSLNMQDLIAQKVEKLLVAQAKIQSAIEKHS